MKRALATGYAAHMDRDEIMRVLRAFEAAGLEYVLIGAAAMGFHGLVRATEGLATPAALYWNEKRNNSRTRPGGRSSAT